MSEKEAWREAINGYAIAASLHREWCKKDPFYITRQADLLKAEQNAREQYKRFINRDAE